MYNIFLYMSAKYFAFLLKKTKKTLYTLPWYISKSSYPILWTGRTYIPLAASFLAPGVVIAAGTAEPGGGASLPLPSPIFARATDRERPVRRGGGRPQLVLAVGEQAATRIGTAAAESGGRRKRGKAAPAMEDAHDGRSGSIGGRAMCVHEVRDRGLGLRVPQGVWESGFR